MPNVISDTLAALSRATNEVVRRLDRLERQGTSLAGVGPSGTVTSVGLSAPSWLTVNGSPITTYGTLALAGTPQNANLVLAGPLSGGAAAPSFRAITTADLPAGLGSGTVTSVGLTMPNVFSVIGTPVTTSGDLAVSLATQAANSVWAGPTSGAAATPTFRVLTMADMPAGVGTGTVTSVALVAPSVFAVTGSPVTGAGTLTMALATQAANSVWAGPSSGAAATPTFRVLTAADVLPSLTSAALSSASLTLTGNMTASGYVVLPALAQPGALTATATATAGSPNGTYYYKVSFVTATGETGYWATASAPVTVASKQIALSAIPTGPAGVTARRIYRATSTAGPFKLVTTINDNTTTSFTDNVADGALGAWQQWRNSTGGQFYGGASGTTWMGGWTTESLHVNGLSVGVNTLPNTNGITIPNGAWIQAMAAAGNGVHNIISCNSSGQLQFGSGFLMGNQSITQLSAISHWGDAVVSSGGDGSNHDYIVNRSAGGTGAFKWYGGSASPIVTMLSNAAGGAVAIGANATPTSLLYVAGPIATKCVVKSASFTVDGSAAMFIVRTGSSADVTATLPRADSCQGREITIYRGETTTGGLTIAADAADTINGMSSSEVGGYGYIRLYSDGLNTWLITGLDVGA